MISCVKSHNSHIDYPSNNISNKQQNTPSTTSLKKLKDYISKTAMLWCESIHKPKSYKQDTSKQSCPRLLKTTINQY